MPCYIRFPWSKDDQTVLPACSEKTKQTNFKDKRVSILRNQTLNFYMQIFAPLVPVLISNQSAETVPCNSDNQ